MIITDYVKDLLKLAENKLDYSEIEDIALINQEKILDAFRGHRLSYRHFAQTNGYGYGDEGRDTLNKVYADIFGTEDAIVSPYIASGTHALTLMLSGITRPNDKIISISGKPYDTLQTVINGNNEDIGSLKDFNISYEQIELINNDFDYDSIKDKIMEAKVAFITRSRGYEWRDALSMKKIEKVIKFIKDIDPNVIIAVDNCYGEFVERIEPTNVGADLIAGSLIKNPGGGLAPNGGYIAGKADLIRLIEYRLTAPLIGREIGSYAYGYQLLYQGLFMAPTTVLNSVKANKLMGQVFTDLGLETMPKAGDKCYDINLSIKFPDKESVIAFCRSIQAISPIDSYVHLEPWDMPGYDCKVIMAAGTFNAGSSIELSADSPIREPYIAYLQGALTYEHAKLATLYTTQAYINKINSN